VLVLEVARPTVELDRLAFGFMVSMIVIEAFVVEFLLFNCDQIPFRSFPANLIQMIRIVVRFVWIGVCLVFRSLLFMQIYLFVLDLSCKARLHGTLKATNAARGVLQRRNLRSRIHNLHPIRLPVMSDKHDDDIEVLVLLIEQGVEALGLVIWTQDKDDPLHRAHNPFSVDFLGFELFRALHMIDCVLDGHFSMFLHLFVPILRSPEACPVLFDILLTQFV